MPCIIRRDLLEYLDPKKHPPADLGEVVLEKPKVERRGEPIIVGLPRRIVDAPRFPCNFRIGVIITLTCVPWNVKCGG